VRRGLPDRSDCTEEARGLLAASRRRARIKSVKSEEVGKRVKAKSVGMSVAAALLVAAVVVALLRERGGPGTAESRPVTQTAAGEASPPPASDWPAFQNGGPLLGVAPYGPKPPLKTRWTFRADAGIQGSAVVADGVVYIGDAGATLYALDFATGTERWRFTAPGGFDAAPFIHDGRVYVGDLTGVFHALSVKTGRQEWSVNTEGEIHSSANLVHGRVIFGSYDHFLYCLDAKSGEVLWKCETGNYVHCTPAVGDGRVYVAGCDGKLTAVDGASGKILAQGEMGGAAAAAPLVLDDSIVVATMGGKVLSFWPPATGDLDAGRARRESAPRGTVPFSEKSVEKGDSPQAVSKPATQPDGEEPDEPEYPALEKRWEFAADGCDFYSSPAHAGGLIVLGGRDDQVYAIDATTGLQEWTFRTLGGVDSSPTIASGRVYVGSKDGTLYVLDLATGKEAWRFTAQGQVAGSPAIASGLVIFGDTSGGLYALGR
jgi:outer membrane protein assembly factor BamB